MQMGRKRGDTHPNAQLDVLPSVHVHARVQQAQFAKVIPVGHEGAANHGRSPRMRKKNKNPFFFSNST